ncbi:unnamed protein product [marine sediment metagenome]|uniref:Uncharacterized protein n=1 Tax=marine sediment metagenome TaxID=412755 RepID=X1A849_9ZZZZ
MRQCEKCGLFHIEGTKCYKETKEFVESEKYFKELKEKNDRK